MSLSAASALITPVILSGGTGSRLWPQSRENYPKQLLALASDKTLIQESMLRVGDPALFDLAVIVCNEEHRFIIAEQMRQVGAKLRSIIVEPLARNTAPAIAAAALTLEPQSLMLVAPADHLITDRGAFLQAVRRGMPAALAGKLVTFGMAPTFPETGYGYIRRGDALPFDGAFAVRQFVEKPDRATAQGYLESGEFFWNSGIFLFRADVFLEELRKYAPPIFKASERAVRDAARDLDFIRLGHDAFAAAPSKSVDYAVMEHTDRAAVVPAQMGWTDIGSWGALWDVAVKDEHGNAWLGDVIAEDTQGCYVDSSGRLTALLGVENLVVVSTPDAVLVVARDRAQDVRRIVDRLKGEGRSEHALHRKVHRPWGHYDTLHDDEHFEVRHISVQPGGTVALQKHVRRAEHWIVLSGVATVTRGHECFQAVENQSVWIPAGSPHRLENRSDRILNLIEVRSGAYLGEDDVVRLENAYQNKQLETEG